MKSTLQKLVLCAVVFALISLGEAGKSGLRAKNKHKQIYYSETLNTLPFPP
jgi:hypothetical protein